MMQGSNQDTDHQDDSGVPEAFYRDAVPPRSPDDPRWTEFNLEHGSDDLPEWLILAAPAALAALLALHGVVAIVLALLTHQRLF